MTRRYRPAAAKAGGRTGAGDKNAAPKTPPLPENPYRRFYTPARSFEELARARRAK